MIVNGLSWLVDLAKFRGLFLNFVSQKRGFASGGVPMVRLF
jgi:hypothetical protein